MNGELMYTESMAAAVKWFASGSLVTVGVAQASLDPTPAGLFQGTALAMLGAIIYWLLQVFSKNQKETTAALRSLHKVVAFQSALLIQHDSTVRGENRETMGSTEDIVKMVMDATRDA